jgi:putative transcriptional regulator
MLIIVNLDKMFVKHQMKSRDLAEIIGITITNMYILKSGKVKAVRFSTIKAICIALDCQPSDILEYVED